MPSLSIRFSVPERPRHSMSKPARKRLQAMAQGRGADERLAVPLAFDAAAQISARPLEDFHVDPTQLANGLSELQRAIGSEVICCALADDFEYASAGGELALEPMLAPGTRVAASLEACRRLRATGGDALALVAGLTGPATLAARFGSDVPTAGAVFSALAKEFCAAGADLILIFEPTPPADPQAWEDALKTTGNIARFHRALALLVDRAGPLPQAASIALDSPAEGEVGVTLTAGIVPADASIETLQAWVVAVGAA